MTFRCHRRLQSFISIFFFFLLAHDLTAVQYCLYTDPTCFTQNRSQLINNMLLLKTADDLCNIILVIIYLQQHSVTSF